jgi:hypothetical protein
MVYVRLARGWTDDEGAAYAAGDMVDIDAVTLAELEAEGVVATQDKVDGHDDSYDGKAKWPGLTTPHPDGHGEPMKWPGLTTPHPDGDGEPMKWPGLTTPHPDGHGGNGANAPLRDDPGLSDGSVASDDSVASDGSGLSDGSEGGGGADPSWPGLT